MSETTAAAHVDPAAIAAYQSRFFKPAVARLRENLELLMGRPIGIDAEPPRLVDGEALNALLEPPAVSLGVTITGGTSGEFNCVVALPLGLTMVGLMQMLPDPQITERLGTGAPPTDAERESLTELGNFIVAAITEPFAAVPGGKFELGPGPVKVLPADAADLTALTGGTVRVACIARVTADPFPATPMVLLLPLELADTWAPAGVKLATHSGVAAPAAPGAAIPAASLGLSSAVLCGSETFAGTFRAVFPGEVAVSVVAGVADLLRAIDAGTVMPLVIVEVGKDREWEIDVAGAIRRHPACRRTRVVVALERPTRQTVMRCGRAGLLDVIPASLDPVVFSRRVAGWFAPEKPATHGR